MSEHPNGVQYQLGEIQAQLRTIQADQGEARQTRRDMYKAIGSTRDELRDVKADVAAVKKTVDEISPDVADYRRVKAKSVGILIGVAALGGGASQGIKTLLAKIGIGS